MENLQSEATRPRAETQVTQKQPYAPPKAAFVPLNLEERLLACLKLHPGCAMPSMAS